MAKIIKKALGVAALIGVAASGGILGGIAKAVLINGALSMASRALMGKRKSLAGATAQTIMIRSTTAPFEIVYGLTRKSGVIAFANTAGSNNEYYDLVLILAGHQVEDITDVWFDDVKIADADINASTGVISGSTKYAGKALIFRYLGTSTQAASSLLDSTYTEWTSNHQFKGLAYIHIRFIGDPETYSNGAPANVYAMVYGKRVYDPRLDSTNGGSGSHRVNDATTWAYSDNPILCAADYLTGGSQTFDVATPTHDLGFKVDDSRVDWATVAAEADVCEEVLSPVVYNDTPQDRYVLGGVLSTATIRRDNMKAILSSCAGQCVRTNGKYYLYAGHYHTPTVTLTDADVVGDLSVQPKVAPNDRYNAVRATYFASGVWQETEARPRQDSSYASDDGQELWLDLDLPMTTNGYRAQRIEELHLRQSRNQMTIRGTFGPRATTVALWSTVYVTSTRLGLSSAVFRCIEWKLSPRGSVQLTLRAESSAAYTDITGSADAFGDYLEDTATDSDPGAPATDYYVPAIVPGGTAGGIPVVGASGGVTSLAPGADGTLMMIDTSQAAKVRWGPTGTPAKGDLVVVSDDGADITLVRVPLGSDGEVLTADSSLDEGVKWAAPGGSGDTTTATLDHDYVSERFTDCDWTEATGVSADGFERVGSTIGIIAPDVHGVGRLGVVSLTVGTPASSLIRSIDDTWAFGLGAMHFRASIRTPAALSDGTNTWILMVGFRLSGDSSSAFPKAGFRYTHGENSGKWRHGTNDGTTTNANDSGVTLAVDTWYKFEIVANAAGTSLEFFIDGVSVGTVTANIPIYSNTAANRLEFGVWAYRTAGSSSRTTWVDYVGTRTEFSSAR